MTLGIAVTGRRRSTDLLTFLVKFLDDGSKRRGASAASVRDRPVRDSNSAERIWIKDSDAKSASCIKYEGRRTNSRDLAVPTSFIALSPGNFSARERTDGISLAPAEPKKW